LTSSSSNCALMWLSVKIMVLLIPRQTFAQLPVLTQLRNMAHACVLYCPYELSSGK